MSQKRASPRHGRWVRPLILATAVGLVGAVMAGWLPFPRTRVSSAEAATGASGNPLGRFWLPLYEATRSHKPLPDVSGAEYARFLQAILIAEQGGPGCLSTWVCHQVIYPVWSNVQALGNDMEGENSSVGLAQLRPETAAQLMQGWIWHAGWRVHHGVTPRFSVAGSGSHGVNSALLAAPDLSIEYLAANLAMGAAVARRFGHEPTLDDLARWHNTGVGIWTRRLEPVDEQVWRRGTAYIRKVQSWLREAESLFGTAPEAAAPP
ncbi:MAG: hypothetical protein HYY05_00250 [Chloroflexi bacterium]|nr:hypothetical protein [Chloroflexota bacterium]